MSLKDAAAFANAAARYRSKTGHCGRDVRLDEVKLMAARRSTGSADAGGIEETSASSL